MSFAAWLRSFGFHALANPIHWATVMARADELADAFKDGAVIAAERLYAEAREPGDQTVLRDVVIELRRRALQQHPE